MGGELRPDVCALDEPWTSFAPRYGIIRHFRKCYDLYRIIY
ncbi:hypothetical protein Aros01_06723 [Streptosporangium roseum]|uniref:Uncharacterized protein n=1 Tax=Streptosporangium roseum (strain ATCC 12428 / DSM 43021 / JCM 3005 / KCTC 9067 / NCIMB 10171 / NRRL 2505 / NI 9100) TaxID=479432 RepID=D2ASE7_STRRD|nr:hypothetical protein Sros_5722 [Streptosporangium roseum DSM 43021]